MFSPRKMAHRIFLKLFLKLRCLMDENLLVPDFGEKYHFWDSAQKYLEKRDLGDFE